MLLYNFGTVKFDLPFEVPVENYMLENEFIFGQHAFFKVWELLLVLEF